ncbi:TetR/AcrR family transcriptional regulator [Novosphingobium sp. JCM 18896]|uniref:TetR/AcrR family transcriptional regulator n=1 Tax=Novosphingobium sp. JCM 18896 TaxID=2989731 RepID=UPI002221F69B|nr:TetR/AcrR family transcriptional regulator [Novosphingobium sp. JCM 18896]MCW1428373.1 TetR/AcrR family transcriptional regulator [Novosphingobium sp. JCM 18896]
MATAAQSSISHNQIGQKLGRKGQETRERIISAMLQLLADHDGPPVTVSGVAKEAQVRPPNVYLYFPDMGELVLAALSRVMDTAEEAYLARLRRRWPDETLHECCLAFLTAHYDFWDRHARLLHMRNAMADASDLRILRYRNDVTLPLIRLLADQIGSGLREDADIACVLLTGLERVATVVTNPQFRIITGGFTEHDQRTYVRNLIAAEAEILAVVIAHRRPSSAATKE